MQRNVISDPCVHGLQRILAILKQEAQLSLGKADRTVYVRSSASDFQSRWESDLSQVTQIQARYVNAVSKAIMNASITDIARGHFARRYK